MHIYIIHKVRRILNSFFAKICESKNFVDNLKNFVPKYEQSDENQGINYNINMYTHTVQRRLLGKKKRISKK